MTAIKKLIDGNGNQYFPQTHTKAVVDDNGYSVESKMQAVQDVVNQAQMAIGAVPSDLAPTEDSTNWVTSGGVYNALQVVQSDVTELTVDIYGVKYEYSLSDLTQGYYQGTVGSAVAGGTNAVWCKRKVLTLKLGQHIKLRTVTRGVAHSYVITDSENIVLYTSGVGSVNREFDVEDSTWAKMYVCCADTGYDVFELSVVEKEGLIPTIETLVAQSDDYEKAVKYVDYSGQIQEGKGYFNNNGTITTRSASSGYTYRSVKIKCAKGDIFAIVTGGVTNINPVIISDSSEHVLWFSKDGGTSGGIFEVNYDNAAYLYVSANQDYQIEVIKKLPLKHEDLIEVDSSYARSLLYATNGGFYEYSGYVGIDLPMVLKKGDTVRLKGKSYQNYRAYLLQKMNGTYLSAISDTDLSIEGYFTWMGDEDVYLYVNGLASDLPYITKFPKAAAATLKHYGKKIATLGDSITSYAASDMGELVRSHLGMVFLRSGNQIDWGNLAEGNATICNFAGTTENFSYADGTVVNGVYVNRTLPNEVLKLLRHTAAEGAQIAWHIASDDSDHSIDTSVATGAGYTTDIPDVIYIAMGTNDWSTTDDFSTVIAQTYSQLDKLTICSSLRWCLETLQNVYPKAAIVCVTPIVRTQRPTAEMEAKCELIKKICAYMAIPVVDGYHISGFSPLSQKIYSSDYIHPNSYTQRIARSIAAQVDALC